MSRDWSIDPLEKFGVFDPRVRARVVRGLTMSGLFYIMTVFPAIIVRQRKAIRRKEGLIIYFEDNAGAQETAQWTGDCASTVRARCAVGEVDRARWVLVRVHERVWRFGIALGVTGRWIDIVRGDAGRRVEDM